MGREQLVIDGFHAGIISAPDAQDIPTSAAVYSQDVDPETGPGVLRGRPADNALATAATGLKVGAFTERDDGKQDLFYGDGSAVKVVKDFAGSRSVETLESNASVTSVLPFTRHVRMGASAGDVRWAGFIEDEQLGTAGSPTVPIVTNARLGNPSLVPTFDKAVANQTHAFGIAFDDVKVYVVERASGQLVETIDGPPFVKLRGICRSHNDDAIWVYDDTGNGILYQIDAGTWAILVTKTLSERVGADTGALVSDIECLDDTGTDIVVLAYYHPNIDPDDVSMQGKWIWTVDTSDTAPLTATDRTPKMTGENADGGFIGIRYKASEGYADPGRTLHAWGSAVASPQLQLFVQMYPVSLVKVASNEVQWLVRLRGTVFDEWYETLILERYNWAGPFYRVNGTTWEKPGVCMLSVKITDTAATKRALSVIAGGVVEPYDVSGAVYREYTTPNPDEIHLAVSSWNGVTQIPYTSTLAARSAGSVLVGGTPEAEYFSQDVAVTGLYSTSGSAPSADDRWLLIRRTGFAGLDSIKAPFIAANDDSVVYYDGGLVSIAVTDNGGTGFLDTKSYYYKTSFTFDGIQEGPLTISTWKAPANSTETKSLTVTIRSGAALSRRITALNVYTASGPETADIPDGYYRLLATLLLTDTTFGQGDEGWVATVPHLEPDGGASYEARTGISETMEEIFVDYEIGAVVNGSLFVGRCRHSELTDASHMIFRSKPFRFDTFDWAHDYLRLPERPVAMAAFNGRLFVLTARGAYRIDPENLLVEDFLGGCGCVGPLAVTVTDRGVVFADKRGVYLTNGQEVMQLSAPVQDTLEADGLSWRKLTHALGNPILVYASRLKQVHCLASYSGIVYSFAFHVPTSRWDIWTMPRTTAATSFGVVVGPGGELYYSDQTGQWDVASLAQKTAYLWKSRRFTLDTPLQRKRFYELSWDTSGTPIVMAKVDGVWALMANGGRHTASYGKECQVQVQGPYGSEVVRSVNWLFRRMAGLR